MKSAKVILYPLTTAQTVEQNSMLVNEKNEKVDLGSAEFYIHCEWEHNLITISYIDGGRVYWCRHDKEQDTKAWIPFIRDEADWHDFIILLSVMFNFKFVTDGKGRVKTWPRK